MHPFFYGPGVCVRRRSRSVANSEECNAIDTTLLNWPVGILVHVPRVVRETVTNYKTCLSVRLLYAMLCAGRRLLRGNGSGVVHDACSRCEQCATSLGRFSSCYSCPRYHILTLVNGGGGAPRCSPVSDIYYHGRTRNQRATSVGCCGS